MDPGQYDVLSTFVAHSSTVVPSLSSGSLTYSYPFKNAQGSCTCKRIPLYCIHIFNTNYMYVHMYMYRSMRQLISFLQLHMHGSQTSKSSSSSHLSSSPLAVFSSDLYQNMQKVLYQPSHSLSTKPLIC